MSFKINGRSGSSGALGRATALVNAARNQPTKLVAEIEIGGSGSRTAEKNRLIARVQARAGRDPFYLSPSDRSKAGDLVKIVKRLWKSGASAISAMDDVAGFILKRILQHFDMSMSRVDVPMRPILETTIARKRRLGYAYPSKPLLATLQLRNSIRIVPTKAK